MVQSWAKSIAEKLGDILEASPEQIEIYAYSLELLLLPLFNFLVIFCIAYIIGTLPNTLVFLAIFAPSRLFGGGVHMSTSIRCLVTSTLIIVGLASLSRLSVSYSALYLMLTGTLILGLYVTAKWVPAVTAKNPINNPQKIIRHKKYMLVLITLWVVVGLALGQAGLNEYLSAWILGLVSSLLLMTPWGFSWIESIDKYLDDLNNKGGVHNA